MEIIAVQTPETLTTLRAEWDALLEGCHQATIFQSWEWNEAWWHTLGQGQQLFILQARECGKLIGLAPFCIRRVSGTPLRRLTFLGTGVSDDLDVLAVSERAQEVCTAFLAYLDASQAYDLADWHALQPLALLRQVLVNGAPPHERGGRAYGSCRSPV